VVVAGWRCVCVCVCVCVDAVLLICCSDAVACCCQSLDSCAWSSSCSPTMITRWLKLAAVSITVILLLILARDHVREFVARPVKHFTLRPVLTEKLKSLTFMHIGKCGTSFILVMREYLDACRVKNHTCNGVRGGGFYEVTAEGRVGHPLSDVVIADVDEYCHGKLVACQAPFHSPYKKKHERHNMVTMLREPRSRLLSSYEWEMRMLDLNVDHFYALLRSEANLRQWLANQTARETNTNVQAAFLLGSFYRGADKRRASDAEDAFTRLREQFVFYGVTDYWGLSVCLFHCELGGSVNAAVECQNTRAGERSSVGLPKESNALVESYVDDDLKLFAMAKQHFFDRVERCNCTDVCAQHDHRRRR